MRRAAAVVLISFSTALWAHPGHAVVDLWHLLTEPDHLAMLLLPVAIAAGLWWRSRRKR